MTRIYICSATGALTTDIAPVGGGVAVIEALIPHLQNAGFELTLLTPGREESQNGIGQSLTVPTLEHSEPERILRLNARSYARFALEWESALARYFSHIDPSDALVIANDTSEGPPFAELHANGFRQMALLHVIVSEFFSRRYTSLPTGIAIGGSQLSALWRFAERRGWTQYAPSIARLVWSKESDLARYIDAPIAPSTSIARSLANCYPDTNVAERTQTVPWGVIGEANPALRDHRRNTLRLLGADPNRFTLLTLSRISPEKRIHLVIDALKLIETQSPSTADRIQLVIAGAPAYMGGQSYDNKLRRDAAELERVKTHFVGYMGIADNVDTADNVDKWRLFAAADAFLSPSHYEAYGLTIAQALASGVPVIAAPHAGARATIDPRCGWIVEPTRQGFAAAIRRALHADETREITRLREHAARWGSQRPFSVAAQQLLRIARKLTENDQAEEASR